MLREAELLAVAESMLEEVLNRIRPQDAALGLPAMFPRAGPLPMGAAPAWHRAETRRLRQVLTEADPADRSAHLLQACLERSLLAHYVAAHLGSTACPLSEELARPLWELTAPDAARWRERGHFRTPLPLPEHVSWRDRFLLTAGHEPHPFGPHP